MVKVERGEMWLSELDPTVGSEIRKNRPCLIVSPPEIHDYLPIVTVVPMITKSYRTSYRVPAVFKEKTGLILLEQIRTLDKQRLIRRMGTIDVKTLHEVLFRLQCFFEI
jgi:mRNA interferase MazF